MRKEKKTKEKTGFGESGYAKEPKTSVGIALFAAMKKTKNKQSSPIL